MESRSSKNPEGCLDMDCFDNEVDMFISNENRKLMDLKLKDNVSLFASETKPEGSEVGIVTDHGLHVNCMTVDDFVKSQVVADINDAMSKEIIVLRDSDSKGVSSKGPSIPRVPVEGPSIQGLLDWYGYNTVKEYLSDTYFLSSDKDNIDEDTIQECYSANSKGKYVPVSKKHKTKVKSPIPIRGCVLGLTNIDTWEDILKKFGVTKQESCADKAKRKRKVSGGDTKTAENAFSM
ncbi:hypothetical protein Tco_0452884 [Tanacetum coccineum]